MFNLFRKKRVRPSKHPKFQNPEVSDEDTARIQEQTPPVNLVTFRGNAWEPNVPQPKPVDLDKFFAHHAEIGVYPNTPERDARIMEQLEWCGHPVIVRESICTPLCRRFVLTPCDADAQALAKQASRMTTLCQLPVDMSVNRNGNVEMTIQRNNPHTVYFGDILLNGDFSGKKLPICIGYDMEGQPIVKDLARLPHLLIGGQTGGGKSILLHNCLCSLMLMSDCEMILVDPKAVELGYYNKSGRVRMVSETSDAVVLLTELCEEMDNRYHELQRSGCRDIDEYNQGQGHMVRKVLVVDELADLMNTAGSVKRTVETCLQRIGQKARACGIHMILCTQTPRKEVLPGTIKANIPAKICLSVANRQESDIILGVTGGEKLSGEGRMIYKRGIEQFTAQSGLISPKEIKNAVNLGRK